MQDITQSSLFGDGKLESVAQLGGIQTGTLDYPQPNGGQSCRVAFFNTGSGLRFTVALDRGGDIVEAFYNDSCLTYLTPNGYVPPSHAYNMGDEWLASWPAGLLTTCGPRFIGHSREEDGTQVNLHGHHSNTPAAVQSVQIPDIRRNDPTMALEIITRDSRALGTHLEVKRRIECALGKPVIHLHDEVTNRGDVRTEHNWMYHVNLGYPLLDEGAKLIYRGNVDDFWDDPHSPTQPDPKPDFNCRKQVTGSLDEHRGENSYGVVLEVPSDQQGLCH